MKILKHGREYLKEHNIILCRCGCEFEYDEDDLIRYDRTIFHNMETPKISDDGYYITKTVKHIKGVKCPECEAKYDIKTTEEIYKGNKV